MADDLSPWAKAQLDKLTAEVSKMDDRQDGFETRLVAVEALQTLILGRLDAVQAASRQWGIAILGSMVTLFGVAMAVMLALR